MIYAWLHFVLAMLQTFGNRSAHFVRISFSLMFVRSVRFQIFACKHANLKLSIPLSSNDVPFIVLHDHLDAVVLLVVGVGLNGAMALNDTVLNMRILTDIYII